MSTATRHVSAHLEATVTESAEMVFSVAVAAGYDAAESLLASVDGRPVAVAEVADAHGTRLHLLSDVPPGRFVLDYEAHVAGRAPYPESGPIDTIRYIRPSRYAESDRLGAIGFDEYGDLEGHELLAAVAAWVHEHLRYVSGSSRFTDGAVDTYLARQGVCRDFAHLVISLLRGRNVPARLASVYAPGLSPMDFHAVVEAYVDGAWWLVDATRLAPRDQMVRIATGRDATDTAFMTVQGGRVTLTGVAVQAWVDAVGELARIDHEALVRLA